MEPIIIFKLIAIVLLVIGNAFFVGSEIALTSVRRSRIKQLADRDDARAKVVQVLHDEPERFYSVTQIGITLVSLALGAIGMVTLTQIINPCVEGAFTLVSRSEKAIEWAHYVSYIMSFFIISFMHVVGGELAPKVMAFHKAESLSLRVGLIINLLYKLMSPVIWIMNHSSNLLLRVFGQKNLNNRGESYYSMSQDEIRTVLSASARSGVLDPDETKMLKGVFDLNEHTVRESMVPRTDVTAISKEADVSELFQLFKETHHSRIPVYEKFRDNIIGVVVMKEVLRNIAEVSTSGSKDLSAVILTKVNELMTPAFIIPESKPLIQLLKTFQNSRQKMAIVLDEYGGTAGIITMKDILEEIVGEYEDEFTPYHRHVKKIEEGQYIVAAASRVSELEPLLDFHFPSGDYVTMAGLVYQRLGRIPKPGEQIDIGKGRLIVLEMEKYRITKLLFQRLSKEKQEGSTLAEEPQSKATEKLILDLFGIDLEKADDEVEEEEATPAEDFLNQESQSQNELYDRMDKSETQPLDPLTENVEERENSALLEESEDGAASERDEDKTAIN